MDENTFIKNFAEQFENGIDVSCFSMDSFFKKLEGWSSLTALSIMAMCNEIYGVILSADEMENAEKISDLYNIVKSRYNG